MHAQSHKYRCSSLSSFYTCSTFVHYERSPGLKVGGTGNELAKNSLGCTWRMFGGEDGKSTP